VSSAVEGEVRVFGVTQHDPHSIDVTLGAGDWIGDDVPVAFIPNRLRRLQMRRHRQCP
jgi:hypothetical protein